MILTKVWAGCPMTRAHRSTVEGIPTDCDCGHPYQNIHHLLYHCPLFPAPYPPVRLLADFPSSFSSALLLLPLLRHLKGNWKEACHRIIRILANQRLIALMILDYKNHEPHRAVLVTTAIASSVTFFRRAQDYKYLFSRQCSMQAACSIYP